ncbi:tRNA (adenosine(37)-N6)-threonylcarbamoyltransferase complex dimerization subunit type 1 TsaB [Peteryoungia desertarenae]|uniref:tRNA (Adenosine(37)-N6)-threonylcarbamoyltransferase complex dimerization subunit type 1 TsaB n=1 Tax=Peteryoungia desertarenae TaxID=1813451 RepID=A0ABX6QM88_9HYPH|nr:tRNA (adenosine(37)-N6)-threonylcarbamoyltransferase complex dimerization subunit type 1 TsaB [Peteryoungia desertarenae]QLF69205.1 tRNA (adenosine(37)-N6)-threonylcarbamoyltransferase complex dimerization subunit type 1 TsaB [Peteryoungia desertarenae]
MIVLAIDTAGVDCSAAVYDRQHSVVLAEVSETLGKGHAERLMAMIDEALAKAGRDLREVSRIAVTVGPGSFTGIRVGVAAARGLALALGVECVGVSTLAVLAATAPNDKQGRVGAAINAHRGEIYFQSFAEGIPLDEPVVLSLETFLEEASLPDMTVVGSAASMLDDPNSVTPADHFPIALVARLGAEAKAQGKPSPLYLRGPDAKPQTGFAVSRL